MKYERKLIKSSLYSYSITIPAEVIEKYGWREKQKLILTDQGHGAIVIRDAKK